MAKLMESILPLLFALGYWAMILGTLVHVGIGGSAFRASKHTSGSGLVVSDALVMLTA